MRSKFSLDPKFVFFLAFLGFFLMPTATFALDERSETTPRFDIGELVRAGDVIGYVIIALSVAMIALIVEHLLSIRRNALMPRDLCEDVHQLLQQRQLAQARQVCLESDSFLGHIVSSGLTEVNLGYEAVEKAMEDASTEQSARLYRKIEYLSVIGTIAPMLGLLGTVWGLMNAFQQFELKSNPQVSELAPGIYRAMVTTLMGLTVAVPALASFAIFRNRIDGLVAETCLEAERVFVDYKRTLISHKKKRRANPPQQELSSSSSEENANPSVPPVTLEREPNR